MGGPGSGNRQQVSPLPLGEQVLRTKRSLARLYPHGLRRVADALDPEKNPDDLRLAFDAGKWVIQMRDGLPKQHVESNISGSLDVNAQLRGLSEADLGVLLAMLKAAQAK